MRAPAISRLARRVASAGLGLALLAGRAVWGRRCPPGRQRRAERSRIEEELEASRAAYRAVIDNVQQVIFKTDARGRFTLLNPAWTELTGWSVEETLNTSFLDYVHPEDRQRHLELFMPVVTGQSARCGREIRYLTKAGGVRWVEAHSRPAVDERGTVVGTFGMLMDITERKHAQEDSAVARERLDHLLASSPAVIYSRDPGDCALTFVSDNVARLFGYHPDEVLGDPDAWASRIHPGDAPRVLRGLCGGSGAQQEQEYRLYRKDGHCRWVRDEWRAVRDAAGTLVEIVGSLADITDKKRGEEERARLSSAVEQASDSIVITDPDGTIVYVNPAYERVTGYGRAELIGRNPRVVKSGKQPPEFYRQMWQTLLRGERWSGCFVNRRKDGTLHEAVAVIFPVRDSAGQLANYVGVLRDVTRERRMEAQLRQAQKMEALGRLAGGVAHDFNNLLTVITGRSELLLQRLGVDPRTSRELDMVVDAAQRAAALTRQLLAFSRQQVLSMQVLDLNAVIANVEKLLRRLIGEDIELVTSLDPDLGRVKADPGQIEQVIMNLAVNSRDAMPRGGRLTIRTGNVDEGRALPDGARAGRHVMLAVSDTGCGIDPETSAQIFEPFFTAKDADAGTGLGLSMVYGIVKQSGGEVAVESEPGQGTRFSIYLPRVDGAAEPATVAPSAAAAGRGRETILVVEDEPGVRHLVRELLEAAGYSVLEAAGGREALGIAAEHPGAIELAISDIVMPEMDGCNLVRRLRELRPDTRSLYMSGYTLQALERYGSVTPDTPILHKPFTGPTLIRMAREALDARSCAEPGGLDPLHA